MRVLHYKSPRVCLSIPYGEISLPQGKGHNNVLATRESRSLREASQLQGRGLCGGGELEVQLSNLRSSAIASIGYDHLHLLGRYL